MYLWFSFITRALTLGAARLVVDYNRHALPLDELESAAPGTVERYAGWLTERGELGIDSGSQTLVIRDLRSRARWFREFAEAIDAMR